MRGFTLIELLVFIAIIGILSSIVLASVNSARMKAACSEGDLAACECVESGSCTDYNKSKVESGNTEFKKL